MPRFRFPSTARRAVFARPARPAKALACAALATALGAAWAAPAAAEVNVYTYRQPFLLEPIIDAFTDETGIEVNTVFAKEGLVERLEAEGANSPADLLIVVDVGNLVAAEEAGVTQAVDSDALKARIPAEDRDPEGHWFGLTNRARIIVTSKDRVEDGLVTSYADLAKPELEGRVCTRSGKHDYMVALIASVIAHEGEETARTWLEGVKENLARKPQGNDRAQVRAIAEGECDVAVINSYYMGVMATDPEQQAYADAVDIVFPNQDGPDGEGVGTHMNISGVVMTSAAPHREDALAFMEFMVSDEAQRLYAEANHEYPVVADVDASELVAGWGDFERDTLPLSEIAKYRTAATKMVDQVDYDG